MPRTPAAACCAIHTAHILNAERACEYAQYVRSMAWAGAVARVIVGLPVEPRAGPESFSEQSPDRRRESR